MGGIFPVSKQMKGRYEMDEETKQYYRDNEMWHMLKEEAQPKKQYEKKSRVGKDYIIHIVERGKIMNDKYREIFNDKTTMYLFLKANIVRGEMINDKYNLLKNYYQKGFLACSYPERLIADMCNTSRYRIEKYIRELRESGIIVTHKAKTTDATSPTIYILGTWQFINGKVSERYYMDDFIEGD